MIGVAALAICVVCPLIDTFDQWDHALQTGHDTEYPLVILALCVGIALVLRRLVLTLSPNIPSSSLGYVLRMSLNSMPFLILPTALAAFPGSPPLSLRI